MFSRLALLTAITAIAFGPPGIRIEAVKDPATAKVKNAVFMVTGRHHADAAGFTVTGRAEGMVAGKRVTRPITLTPAGAEGVYGVTRQWDAGQPWILVFTVTEGGHDDHGVAEGMVKIAPNGSVLGIDYPMGKLDEKTPWPRKATAAEIDAALAAMAKR